MRDILAGSVEAWHEFIHTYSGLINSVIVRYVFDEDERRTVLVEVLDRLYRGLLAQYEGRAALSTWLVLVSRSTVLDHLRRTRVRREVPAAVKDLPSREIRVFHLYYLQGLSFDAVRHRLGQSGVELDAAELAGILLHIQSLFSRRKLRRLEIDRQECSCNAIVNRLREFHEETSREREQARESLNPETELLRKEARASLERVLNLLGELPDQERAALDLHFEQGKSAREIARELDLPGPRRAYSIIDRAIRRIRTLLGRRRIRMPDLD